MSKVLLNPRLLLLRLVFYTSSILLATGKMPIAEAQVTPDNTVGTQVNNNGSVAEITGGETRGENLFHSFQDFSVTTGNEAFFNNADNIGNIFSRVTGGNISNIDGLIRANGAANLFMINPAGIMFGENASLSIGGSFYGSTADSILFEGGEFSATNLDTPPLLTINAPIGFNFRDNPGDIANNGATLGVNSNETFALLGGNLSFDGGILQAVGGQVELGGLTQSGTVDLNENGSLSFPETVARGNVSFSNNARVFVLGNENGSININAKNLSLTSRSIFFAGIGSDLGFADAQAGDVVIDLTEDLALDNSNINNINFGTGNTGDVRIDARNISFTNGGVIGVLNDGIGNSGRVFITATEDITFDGINGASISGITNSSTQQAVGTIGEINLTAQNLNIINGGSIFSQVSGNNDAGDINLNIADTIRVDGSGLTTINGTQSESPSDITSGVSGGNGNSGSLNLQAQNLVLSNQGSIGTANTGLGNSGDIEINVDSLAITEGGDINGGVFGTFGTGSNITINAQDSVSVTGNSEFRSSISATIGSNAAGQAGNINIETPKLIVQDGFISADVLGNGEGGNININAQDSVSVTGNSESFSSISADIGSNTTGQAGNINIETPKLIVQDGFISADVLANATGNGGNLNIETPQLIVQNGFISADVFANATGNGGNLNIKTEQLTLSDGSIISATTSGNGNAGNVTIIADESVDLSGVSEFSRGGIFVNALIENGNGGNIDLTTGQLTISDGAAIIAGNFSSLGSTAPGSGEPGNITIAAQNIDLASGGRIEATTQAETGTGANIDLQVADNISLRGDSFISAEALGDANGGNLNIDTNFIIAFPEGNNDIIASADRGQGGNINIVAESLLGIEERPLNPFTNDINASSEFGLDGSISINTPDVNPLQGAKQLPAGVVDAEDVTAQVCSASRDSTATNALIIDGKGGVPASPDLPLDSTNLVGYSNANSVSDLPPLKTSRGDIQPARGIRVGKDGQITLTAYRTDAKGDRLDNINSNCGIK